MKYLKISLPKQPGGNLIYPDRYQSEIGDYAQDHLYFDDENGANLLLLISDEDYKDTMVRDKVVEITEDDAKNISATYDPSTEVIANEAALRVIEIKSRLGMTLTTDEMNSIDPNIPGGAVEMSKTLSDRIDTAVAAEKISVVSVEKTIG
jgi:hypothetical protein